VSTGRHDATTYERPTLPFVCGRKSLWRKACWQGPSSEGGCGGAFECAPVRVGDRFECRRPKQAGGRCDQGPYPSGACSQRHAACAPVTSMRRTRGRISLASIAVLLIVLILGPDPTATSVVNPAALDAGNLSSVHAGFTRDQGCVACHASHEKDAASWVLAAFTPNDPSARCIGCHGFAEPVMGAHNMKHASREGLAEVSCVKCHAEHRGATAALSKVPDFACANCHQRSFASFASHPAFGERYPYSKPGAINFNHSKHIKEYFTDAKHARRSPKFAAVARNDCTVCHAVESATREVRPKPFAEICAGCHESQIRKAVLPLFEPERLTFAASALLGLEKDGDEAEAAQRQAKAWSAMSQSGADALAGIAAGGGRDAARKKQAMALFEGLSPQTAQAMGAALARKSVQGGSEDDPPGWGPGETAEGGPALVYRPRGHADPVVRAWNEFLRIGTGSKEELRGQIASDALQQFLDADTGPGACGKCHAAAVRNSPPEKVAAAWKYAGSSHRPLVRYSHAPHLELLDPAGGCRNCHELNASAKYADYHKAGAKKPAPYESNFAGIKTESCVACHREGHVNSACQVCHSYHQEHRLNLGFRTKTKAEDKKKEKGENEK
jgi:predicted CXXCH cytochrome family protein